VGDSVAVVPSKHTLSSGFPLVHMPLQQSVSDAQDSPIWDREQGGAGVGESVRGVVVGEIVVGENVGSWGATVGILVGVRVGAPLGNTVGGFVGEDAEQDCWSRSVED
jgi:hypothetical protein